MFGSNVNARSFYPSGSSRKWWKAVTILSAFVLLEILRFFAGAFGVSLGYLYVTVVSLAGFWFGPSGGVIAAIAASTIFLFEVNMFSGWPGREIVVNGLLLRLFVYFLSGGVMGYLALRDRKKNERLEELDSIKNSFLGMAAHDLRNPLSVIRDSSSFLISSGGKMGPEKSRRFLVMIKRSSEFMLHIVNDLLDVSRIESGKLHLELSLCEYPVLVRENIEFNSLFAEKKGITIRSSFSGELPGVYIDREKIFQVLNNLIGNSIKYCPHGSAIDVNVRFSGNRIITEVSDNGKGIPEKELRNIFLEFYRPVSKRDGAAEVSSGLGLAIVKKIIEGHGGEIEARSEEGKGALFIFTIPVHRE
jgi:signal transduction histidine kinase